MKKRIFAILLAVSLCMSLFVIGAEAASTSKVLDINWSNIAAVGNQQSGSYACGCYALAYCRTILDGKVHKWYEYNLYNGKNEWNVSAYWARANYYPTQLDSKAAIFQAAYNSINNGRPIILYVRGSGSDYHFVAVVGYTGVTNIGNLSEKNFLYIDSVAGTTKSSVTNMGGKYTLWKDGQSGYKYEYISTYSGSVGGSESGNTVNTPTSPNESTLTIKSPNAPTTLKQGTYFSLKGTVESNNTITSITGEILNSSGSAICTYTDRPSGTYSYTIYNSDLDKNMTFNKLPLGTYALRYTVTDSSGKTVTWVNSFTITSKSGINLDTLLFDAKLYHDLYPDLAQAFGMNEAKLYEHWVVSGKKEGRVASVLFDAKWYLQQNPDVAKAYGANNYEKAYYHFCTYGLYEGRQGSPFFSAPYYLEQYRDLKDAFGDDYVQAANHFITFGIKEMRQGSVDFSIQIYSDKNPDVVKVFPDVKDRIMHYILYVQYGNEKRVCI